MKAKEYELLQQCVESGVRCGWAKAYKHTDTPDADAVHAAIEDAVLGAICDAFDLDPRPGIDDPATVIAEAIDRLRISGVG